MRKITLALLLLLTLAAYAVNLSTYASVEQCRSYDHNIYFHADDGTHGWYQCNDAYEFSIATAAQASGKKVRFGYTSYNPDGAAPGVGRYTGIALAL